MQSLVAIPLVTLKEKVSHHGFHESRRKKLSVLKLGLVKECIHPQKHFLVVKNFCVN